MARPKKSLVGSNKKKNDAEADAKRQKKIERFIDLVDIVRKSKNSKEVNIAFNEIIELMQPKIKQISYKMNIPGCQIEDLTQEALIALCFKAIKDYDPTRSLRSNISPFDSFASLCIRRHLSTKLKSSFQSKQKVLNSSISLDQDRSKSDSQEEPVSLADIVPSDDCGNVASDVSEKEDYNLLIKLLWGKMSYLERQVFVLYRQNFSYEKIAELINNKNKESKKHKVEINVKSVDNALSRVKYKAKKIYQNHENDD
jgi:RNA polymerase sporulation-specific sigma factor